VSQFRKKYILDSKYLIFGYKAFLGIFKVINNKECRLQYLHNHKYVEEL
jgi:hypothetical protein